MTRDRRAKPTSRPHRDDLKAVASRVFAPATSSVTEARHWVREVADRWELEEEPVERLAFNTTELAANAVMHARTPFRVSLRYDGRRLRVEVEDASGEPPRQLRLGPYATAGRGIAMIRALSRRTGVRRNDDGGGKAVWAEIDA